MKKKIVGITLASLVAWSVQASIILDDSMSSLQVGQGSVYTVAGFDATSSDKLVVTVAAEGNGGSRLVSWIEYDGVSLSPAVNYYNTAGFQSVAVYYLDNPAAAGDLVIDWNGSVNGVGVGLYALSGTAAGHEAANTADGDSVSLTTQSDNAFVASVFVSNGGSSPSADAPLTQLYGSSGTSVGSAESAAGYILDAGIAGANALSYSGYSGSRPTTAAVSFSVIPEPATLGLLAAFGGGILFVRRRFSI